MMTSLAEPRLGLLGGVVVWRGGRDLRGEARGQGEGDCETVRESDDDVTDDVAVVGVLLDVVLPRHVQNLWHLWVRLWGP